MSVVVVHGVERIESQTRVSLKVLLLLLPAVPVLVDVSPSGRVPDERPVGNVSAARILRAESVELPRSRLPVEYRGARTRKDAAVDTAAESAVQRAGRVRGLESRAEGGKREGGGLLIMVDGEVGVGARRDCCLCGGGVRRRRDKTPGRRTRRRRRDARRVCSSVDRAAAAAQHLVLVHNLLYELVRAPLRPAVVDARVRARRVLERCPAAASVEADQPLDRGARRRRRRPRSSTRSRVGQSPVLLCCLVRVSQQCRFSRLGR